MLVVHYQTLSCRIKSYLGMGGWIVPFIHMKWYPKLHTEIHTLILSYAACFRNEYYVMYKIRGPQSKNFLSPKGSIPTTRFIWQLNTTLCKIINKKLCSYDKLSIIYLLFFLRWNFMTFFYWNLVYYLVIII